MYEVKWDAYHISQVASNIISLENSRSLFYSSSELSSKLVVKNPHLSKSLLHHQKFSCLLQFLFFFFLYSFWCWLVCWCFICFSFIFTAIECDGVSKQPSKPYWYYFHLAVIFYLAQFSKVQQVKSDALDEQFRSLINFHRNINVCFYCTIQVYYITFKKIWSNSDTYSDNHSIFGKILHLIPREGFNFNSKGNVKY